ncbi:putative quinol monooxygenase [Puia sp.]|uniref:putative quinol monooxygenase n=1 Tax=Puia sp. TaxID=2045100 RepID=UPI0039C9AA50
MDKRRCKLACFVAYARYTVHPGDKQRFAEAINLYRVHAKASAGNLYFYCSWGVADANTCIISEGWIGEAAMDRHLGIEPVQNGLKTIIECLRITGGRTTFFLVSKGGPS